MKRFLPLPALAALALSACVTGYGYSNDGYYYGRPSASVGSYGTYGSIGYGSGNWRYGYGAGYGYPGYSGYFDPYSGYYYDPYHGYYFPRPPVVIIQRPPGDNHGDHDHGDDNHDDGDQDNNHGKNGRRPPWRDLNQLGDRAPIPAYAPDAGGDTPPRSQPPVARNPGVDPPLRARMPAPTPPVPQRVRMPDPPSAPSMDDSSPTRKGDRRR
jgi:hypothetical protein